MVPTSNRIWRLRTAFLVLTGFLLIFAGMFTVTLTQAAPPLQDETVVPTQTNTPLVTTPTATGASVIETLTAVPTATNTLSVTTPLATDTPTATTITTSETISDIRSELTASVNNTLNLRTGPDQSHSLIQELPTSTLLTVIGRNPECTWLHVQPDDGGDGWVAREYVSVFQIVVANGVEDRQPVVDVCETVNVSPVVQDWTPTPEPSATPTPEPSATPTPEPSATVTALSMDTPQTTPEATAAVVTTVSDSPAEDSPAATGWRRFMVPTLGLLAVVLVGLLLWRGTQAGWLPLSRAETGAPKFSVPLPRTWLGKNKHGWLTQLPQPGISYLEGKLASNEVVFAALTQKAITIGRDADNQLVVNDSFADADSVSRQHARIEQDGERFVVTDLKSQNGVYINGRRTRENLLFDGARITLGKVELVFHENNKQ